VKVSVAAPIAPRSAGEGALVPVDLGTLAQSRPLDPPSPIWNVVLTPRELQERVGDMLEHEAEEGMIEGPVVERQPGHLPDW